MIKKLFIPGLLLLGLLLILIGNYSNTKQDPKFISKKEASDYKIILEVNLGAFEYFEGKQFFIKPKNKKITVINDEVEYTIGEALNKKIISRETLELQTDHLIVIVIYDFDNDTNYFFYEDEKYIYSYEGTYTYNIMYKKGNNTIEEALKKNIINLELLNQILPFQVTEKETGTLVELE